ncbi:MAG: hypothetical protein AAF532_02280 [Planctomycetota bacterium]
MLPVVLEFRDPGPGESAVSITWTGSDGRPKSWVGWGKNDVRRFPERYRQTTGGAG